MGFGRGTRGERERVAADVRSESRFRGDRSVDAGELFSGEQASSMAGARMMIELSEDSLPYYPAPTILYFTPRSRASISLAHCTLRTARTESCFPPLGGVSASSHPIASHLTHFQTYKSRKERHVSHSSGGTQKYFITR